jgi:DNA repair exonuclease SbcCD ATPase subunit
MLRIGSDRARTAELPKARENLREAEAELAMLDSVRRAVAERAAELERTQSRIEEVRRDTVRLQARYLLARRKSLSRRLAALREAEAAIERADAEARRLAAHGTFPIDLRDRVVTLDDRRRGAESRVGAARAEFEARAARVTEAGRLEFEALSVSVGQLSSDAIAGLEKAAYGPTPAPVEERGLIARLLARLVSAARAFLAWVLRRHSIQEAAADADTSAEETPFGGFAQDEAVQLLERHRRYLMLKPVVEAQEEARLRLQREEQVLTTAVEQLVELVAAATRADLDAAVATFLDGCDKRVAYEAAVAAGREADERHEALLGGRSREEIERLLDETSSRLDAILAGNPEIEAGDTDEPAAAIEERIKALDAERHALEIASARLEEELRGALGDHRARADVEEDAERWRREVAHLEKRREAARIAREVIDEAMTEVYRDFAPAVSSFLSDGFTHVTEGRYQRALVDPRTLEVSLLLPETHQVIKDPPVSRGTLALAYILMRIGLAQHMSAVAEPVPLVLDDPFVDLDERRLRLTLDFIAELSDRMQVFLFTKDQGIARWLETTVPSERHRLHMLSRLATPASAL